MRDTRAERWERQFAKLVAFQQRFGHCRVGKQDGSGGRLHKWIIRQRGKSRRNLLSPEQCQRLDEIGIDWTGRQFQLVRWEKRFAQLVDFKARFGHCDVHGHWSEDPLFAHWVSNQRSFRNQGKLKPDRIARLEQIGFKWDNRYRRDALIASYQQHLAVLDRLWDAKLAELVEYKKQHGHCRVPRHHIPTQKLGDWVFRQRREARLQRLRPDRRQRLEEIGFAWDFQPIGRERWENNWAKLIAFKAAHGHCHVPYDYPPDPSLGRWVYTQRRRHQAGQLSSDLCARLDQIGFRWLLPIKPVSSASSFHAQLVALNRRWEKRLAAWR